MPISPLCLSHATHNARFSAFDGDLIFRQQNYSAVKGRPVHFLYVFMRIFPLPVGGTCLFILLKLRCGDTHALYLIRISDH